jgi:hypothetical protein
LFLEGADEPIGDCEFVFALPTDNPYLSQGYLARLRGLKPHMKRRYLEGKWEFIGGLGFFDPEALMFYEDVSSGMKPFMQGATAGDVELDAKYRLAKMGRCPDPPRVKPGNGGLMVWRKPDPAKRYVMAIDVSSGGSYDFSAIQVVCVDDFEQVAEWQGKIDPDLVATEAYRIGRIFNNALAVPEITGGWGASVDQRLKKLRYPKLYTQTVLTRLSKKWTDRTGWDTTARSRQYMLDTLEEVLREKEFGLFSPRAVAELGAFVYEKKKDGRLGKPEARDGANDDLVMSLAIAVTVALSLPRQLRKQKRKAPKPAYPWLRQAA